MSQASAALRRIAGILDEGSFAELGEGVVASGVVTGFGTIGSKPVYVFSQDPDVKGGSIGIHHAEKIVRLYKMAIKTQTPILGLVDTSGIRLDEGAETLFAFGKIFRLQAKAKGVIPQVFAVFNNCGGSMAISAGMSDFLFMTKDAKIFVNPAATREYSGRRDGIADALAQNPASTRLCYYSGTENEVFEKVRTLYDFLPLSDLYSPEMVIGADDMNRVCAGIEAYKNDPKALIEALADEGKFAPAHVCPHHAFGLIRLGGQVTAVIASAGDPLKARALDRFEKFVSFAADYGIPLVTLTNADGFSTAEGQEELLPQSAARLAYIYALAPVAKVNVIVGKASGAVLSLMNSSTLGADFVYAWDCSEVQVMPAEQGAKILFADEIAAASNARTELAAKTAEYAAMSGKEAFVAKGFIDKVIQPCDTRKYLIGSLQMLMDKAEF